MDVLGALEARDGIATFGELLSDGVPPAALARAVSAGVVARPHRGVYVLPTSFAPFAAARRLRGVVSHQSAATFHGFELLSPPGTCHVTVPRALHKAAVPGVVVHRRDLDSTERLDRWPVTDAVRTCLDCFRVMPLREALVVGDSALRQERVLGSTLRAEAERLKGPGSAVARQVAGLLDPRHESVLESVACAEMHLADLPPAVPQVVLDTPLGPRRVDFWFPEHRVGVETDGFETHGSRARLLADCERHNGFVLGDLVVLRFGFEHVVRTPSLFTSTVDLALRLVPMWKPPQCIHCGAPVRLAAA